MGDHNPSRGGVRGIKGVCCCYGREYTEGVAGVDILLRCGREWDELPQCFRDSVR